MSDNNENELKLADNLGNGYKKIRLNIKSKGKGSSGGARVISWDTIISIEKTDVKLLSIYDKSEYSNIDLDQLKKNLNL